MSGPQVKMVSVFSCASTAISTPILSALNDTISLQVHQERELS